MGHEPMGHEPQASPGWGEELGLPRAMGWRGAFQVNGIPKRGFPLRRGGGRRWRERAAAAPSGSLVAFGRAAGERVLQSLARGDGARVARLREGLISMSGLGTGKPMLLLTGRGEAGRVGSRAPRWNGRVVWVVSSGRPRAARPVACPPAGRSPARLSPLPLREGLEIVLARWATRGRRWLVALQCGRGAGGERADLEVWAVRVGARTVEGGGWYRGRQV